ncbi:hypothetical protein SDC9_185162 [bioreactor metagenome]|uniref:Uncharacterized protein n=1 Tax=bioreactor metagenome TaxID=1076179 RepID=A0A645HGX8_9ZZZZ
MKLPFRNTSLDKLLSVFQNTEHGAGKITFAQMIPSMIEHFGQSLVGDVVYHFSASGDNGHAIGHINKIDDSAEVFSYAKPVCIIKVIRKGHTDFLGLCI